MIKTCFNEENNNVHKPSWLSMVSKLETKEYLLGLGFNIGSRTFATTNKRVAEGKASKFDKPPRRPKKVTLEELLRIKVLKKPENSFQAAQPIEFLILLPLIFLLPPKSFNLVIT
jgi:hypothetical protein